MNTRKQGKDGEIRAFDHLVNLGYNIINRNYETKVGEIDCIAYAPEGTLVFVEVKSSHSSAMGNPLFRVNRAKQRKLMQMAKWYMAEHKLTSVPCRFDVIGVSRNTIDHVKNAFLV